MPKTTTPRRQTVSKASQIESLKQQLKDARAACEAYSEEITAIQSRGFWARVFNR